ncbi:unnamed protein product [marine sediment metagenome]|uniref:Uncharacterized protein n=1 Tax=marine sediment metagenome TaxID=412755 RepID=X0VY34_9ZZZZ
MEVTIIVGGISGLGVLALITERIVSIRRDRKNGGSNGEQILKALGDLNKKSDLIKTDVGATQSDVRVVKNEVSNINKRCTSHLENQGEINRGHANAISKNTDKLFTLATKKKS